MQVSLVSYTSNPVKAIELAASNCYDSKPSKGRIMMDCYKSGHHSVLEFADFHFHIEGVSRALSHQLVRHRIASFAQRSQRYVEEDEFSFETPKSILSSLEAHSIYNRIQDSVAEAYLDLVNMGIPKEDARYLLTNATHTIIDVKMNLRAFINFCNERLCSRAQWEIRKMAGLMVQEVIKVEPKLAEMLVPKCERNKDYPFCPESKRNCCGRQPHISEIYKG